MDMKNEFHASASRLFADRVTPALQAAAEAGQLPSALWREMESLGLGLVLVDEEHGGVGAGLADAAAIALAAGEHAVPGPLVEWMLGNALLAGCGRPVSAEPVSLAFAPAAETADAVVEIRDVPWAAQVAQHLVVGAQGLAVLAGAAVSVQAESADVGGEPHARLRSSAPEWQKTGMDGAAVLRRAALLRGAQMIGAMRWCLERTAAYTQERKQFGREIAKFQVVQQMMAEMASAVVAAHCMLDAAIAEPDNVAAVAAARSRLGDASDVVFAHAHQVHGAIGFSHEYVLHFRTRRLMAWRDQFGTVADWRRQLAAQFAGCDADGVWPVIAG